MIDSIIEKHNHEEQDKIRACSSMSEAEKTQMIDMLDSTLDGTNGYITDEKVKRLAINSDKLAVLFSQMFRRSADSDAKGEKDMESLRNEVRDIADDVKAIRKDSQQNDESLGRSIDALRDGMTKTLEEIKDTVAEVRDRELLREGAEKAESPKDSADDGSITMQTKIMDWVTKNQFWLLIVIIIIAAQGGNLSEWLLRMLGR